MRFLPLSEGVHQVDTLGLVGVGDGFAVNLKCVPSSSSCITRALTDRRDACSLRSVCNVIVKA